MSRVNVYLPDELAERARAEDLNVSALTQAAIEDELARRATDTWLARLGPRTGRGASHEAVIRALDEARNESGDFVDQR